MNTKYFKYFNLIVFNIILNYGMLQTSCSSVVDNTSSQLNIHNSSASKKKKTLAINYIIHTFFTKNDLGFL